MSIGRRQEPPPFTAAPNDLWIRLHIFLVLLLMLLLLFLILLSAGLSLVLVLSDLLFYLLDSLCPDEED